jgi:hypothetical protein
MLHFWISNLGGVRSLGIATTDIEIWICIVYLWNCWFLTLVRNLSAHLNLTWISLDWTFKSLPSYTPRFAHAALWFLCSGGDDSLLVLSDGYFSFWLYFQSFRCWWPHLCTKQLAHNLVSNDLHWLWSSSSLCLACTAQPHANYSLCVLSLKIFLKL